MNKQSVMILVLALVVILAGVGVGGIWYVQRNEVDYTTVEFIDSYMKSKNNFADISNEIDVHSIDDIAYALEGDHRMRIFYGKQVIKIVPKAFEDSQFMEELKGIGIEIQTRTNPETGQTQYRVLYWGEPIDEIVKTS